MCTVDYNIDHQPRRGDRLKRGQQARPSTSLADNTVDRRSILDMYDCGQWSGWDRFVQANTAANMHLLHVICTAHCAALRCAARVYRVSVHAATALRRKHVDQALYKAQRTAGWFLVYSAAPTDSICENSILGYSTPISKLPLFACQTHTMWDVEYGNVASS